MISVKKIKNFGSVDANIVIRVSFEKWDRTNASKKNKSARVKCKTAFDELSKVFFHVISVKK